MSGAHAHVQYTRSVTGRKRGDASRRIVPACRVVATKKKKKTKEQSGRYRLTKLTKAPLSLPLEVRWLTTLVMLCLFYSINQSRGRCTTGQFVSVRSFLIAATTRCSRLFQSRSQSLVPFDQRSENESSGSNHFRHAP